MGHTVKVDRLLIRTAADQAGIGDNDGHITGSAPTVHRQDKSGKGSRRRHPHQPSPTESTGSSTLTIRKPTNARRAGGERTLYAPVDDGPVRPLLPTLVWQVFDVAERDGAAPDRPRHRRSTVPACGWS
jgi:hypothetical protein